MSHSIGRFLFRYWLPVLTVLYLIFLNLTTGVRPDHYSLIVLVNVLFFASPFTKRLITGLSIFVVYWMIFDSMKAWPNWSFSHVDIEPIYLLEKKLFGIHHNGTVLTPNEYFDLHANVVADTISSIFYLCWIPVPLAFSIYLYFTNKDIFLRFLMCFFTVNIVGFIVYYSHPAAPPWYYRDYGDVLITGTKSNAAGLLRFDHYYGVKLFEDLYAKGSNVFAAMPSLHAAYPLAGIYYAFKQRLNFIKAFYIIITIGIWISAIYLYHHYVLDVIAGIACALIGLFVFEKILMKAGFFRRFFNYYLRSINVPEEKEVITELIR